jgi:hypothetical protein
MPNDSGAAVAIVPSRRMSGKDVTCGASREDSLGAPQSLADRRFAFARLAAPAGSTPRKPKTSEAGIGRLIK